MQISFTNNFTFNQFRNYKLIYLLLMDGETKTHTNKMVNFLKKVNNQQGDAHLYSTINPQNFRQVRTPILAKQQEIIHQQKTYQEMMLHRKHHVFIPISRKMKPIQSKNNLYLSVQEKFILANGEKTLNEEEKMLNKSDIAENQCKSLRIQNKNQQTQRPYIAISLETKNRFDGRNTVTNGKLYQIPMTSNQLKQKFNKNVVSFLKIPDLNKGDMNANLKNFSTFYEFQGYLSKLSNAEKVQGLIEINNTKYKKQNKDKKCSIIPAFHLSGNSRLKKNTSSRKKDLSSNNFNDYILAKKVRKQIEKSLIVESKKQELISNMVNKYKSRQNKNQENNLSANSGDYEELRNKSMIQIDQRDAATLNAYGLEKGSLNQGVELHQRNQTNPSRLKNGTKLGNQSAIVSIALEGGVYEQKMASYRQFIFMVNLAHRVFDPLIIVELFSLTKLQKNMIKRYYYYVGPGNNSMLIRSLMKRRSWWEETKNIDEAQFVWTQLKIPTLLEKQQCYNSTKDRQGFADEIHRLQEELKQLAKDNQPIALKKANKREAYTSMQNILAIQKCIHNPNQQSKYKNLAKSNIPKGLMFKAPFLLKEELKILTEKDAKLYKNSLKSVINDSNHFENRIKYMPKNYLTAACDENNKIHNHFQGNHSLGNKKALLHHILLYYKLTNKPADKAFPKTYHIRNGESDPQFKLFLQQYKRIEKDQPLSKNVWILKPGQNSNRGNGITVIKELKQIKTMLKGKEKHKNGQNFTYILQKYIEKPLLYKGRKFDIRHYMIISGLHGKLRAYWYGQGYVRTSSYMFGLSNLTDPMIHLTNDAIQKQSDDYGYYQEGNKISYNQLQKYYAKYFPLKQFSMDKIYGKMRDLCVDAVNAAYFSLDPNKKMHNFQVFGLDFMIDDNFEVNLIEINTNPCLELSSNLLERVIPSMLQQTFRLTIDPLFPPSYHYTNNTRYMAPDCNLQKFQFELIFDQERDGVGIKKLYEENIQLYKAMIANLTGSEREQDDVYQNEGEQIEIDKII